MTEVNALTQYEETSFWARDYGPYEPNPSLKEDISVDVAIVGGGFSGLNTAREFMKDNPNAKLAVLEGDVIGYGASGRNGGFNMTLFGIEPQITIARWGKQRTIDAYHHVVKAVNYTKQIIEENNLDSKYSHPGFLKVAYSDSQVKTLRGCMNVFDKLGLIDHMGMHWIEKEKLQEEFNSPMFSAGLYEKHTGLLHPTRHVRELKRLAMEAGAQVYEQTKVELITKQPHEIVLKTPNGTVRAQKVFLATNAFTHLLQGLKGTFSRQFPLWTPVIVTEKLTDAQWDSIGWKARYALEDSRQLLHYFRPTHDGRILFGGQDVWAPWGMYKDMNHDGKKPQCYKSLESYLKRIFPSLKDVKVAYRWSGAVSANADTVPEISFVGDERIICQTGLIGHGVSMTHLNGRLIADLLNDSKTDLTDFWIVNRKAIRLPGKMMSFFGAKLMRNSLYGADKIFERKMPG